MHNTSEASLPPASDLESSAAEGGPKNCEGGGPTKPGGGRGTSQKKKKKKFESWLEAISLHARPLFSKFLLLKRIENT